jgi:hypothetical protein
VHDAGRVDRAQALSQSRRQREHRPGRQRAVPGDRFGERRPGDVGGGQPRHRCVYVGVDHCRCEQAAYRPRRGDFAGEPVPEFGLLGKFGPDYFHRD